jgi:hypothetical protein
MDEKIKEIVLAFKHQKFSGIIVNGFLIEEGEVIDYIKNQETRIKELGERVELAEATRDDALAYAKMYKERVKELENELSRIAQVMCGKNKFPGDLAQYVRNEVDGRMKAEARVKELGEGMKNAYEVIDYSGGGDSWEREVTEKERKRFYEIYDKLVVEKP